MKTIKLMDQEFSIEKEYEMAVCIWETVGNNLETFEDEEIKLGQKVFNIKILTTGSIIFTLSPESESYFVTLFPQMFGFPTDEQMNEIKRLEQVRNEAQDKINEIYSSITRAGYTDIP